MAGVETAVDLGRMGMIHSPRKDKEHQVIPIPAKSESPRSNGESDSENESPKRPDKQAKDCQEADPLLLAAALLGDKGAVAKAETYIEAIRTWRASEEKNLRQQLEDIDKAAVHTDDGTDLMTAELEDLLSRGSDIVARIKTARTGLEKEIHAITLAANSEDIKVGDFQTQLEAAPAVPSLADQTDEVIRLELRFTELARMQSNSECEQKNDEAELEKLESDIGQYCCDIAEALEEVTKTERRPALSRHQLNLLVAPVYGPADHVRLTTRLIDCLTQSFNPLITKSMKTALNTITDSNVVA
ncbi:conserved hypothetical protein [Neospora caninum Liverpool]|uniref:Uncharacterized protein n=1 Tax=Neospora caninum (strain Liverpool) TaxID=572307 RepID=F0VQH3_NEOCL|nr:conserved hypothetical protein [Neospora caninum Liverpool]CBZ55970.1 conserved hypothetical protein [Neospora caninum Liverpool]CEL70716.1 TPA: hypothetical protein BN1204_063960 [Neospora caninum Liverpool]|eukprot:XP_003885996.1 conserved hypothetical protein [Neospora caninum Liverpool]